MNLESMMYNEDLESVLSQSLPWERLNDKVILITGANGLIGSCVVDLLMKRNEKFLGSNIKVIALARNEQEGKNRFAQYLNNKNFVFVKQDVTKEFDIDESADFIIHAASNAHPNAFSVDPVNTILTNVIGINNLFKYAINKNAKRLLFVSSGEIYGQGTQDIEEFTEEYIGNVDSMQLRAGYPISKKAGENLCIAYSEQYNIESVVVRPCHIYGPTITPKDSRAFAQFFRMGINGKDIVMKSKGEQLRSYCYVIDCASAIIFALLNGENRNAYNIANPKSVLTIYELAQLIAKECSVNIIFNLPNEIEKKGYNTITKSVLNSNKLQKLGWIPKFDINCGINHTVKILKENL